MSDSVGNLLYYKGHDTIWNGQHQFMPNGTGLITDASSEQSTVTIPRPLTPYQYYLFTSDYNGNVPTGGMDVGLFYHLIDMTLGGGLGDVVPGMKNIVLIDSTAEMIVATEHANGIDYWVMIRECASNEFHAFLVTQTGVNPVPVTTAIGPLLGGSCEGQLRFNHKGDMLACTYSSDIELYDLDNTTGQLSNIKLMPKAGVAYGAEFSADDTKLYTGGPVQFDVTLSTAAAIQASAVNLFLVTPGSSTLTRGLQYGLDGKIYGINWGFGPNGYMSVINNPNEAGVACNYQDSAIYLEGRTANEAVPNFLSSYFNTTFYADNPCAGDTTFFNINYHFITNVSWNFGDPASGAANTSTLVNAFHVYDAPGPYIVTLIAQNGAVSDTVVKTIYVKEAPNINLGPDVAFCSAPPDSVKLLAGTKKGQYAWSDGSTDSTLWASATGAYSVTFTNECGSDDDTIQVEAALPLSVQLPLDTLLCDDSYEIIPVIQNESALTQYIWTAGDTTLNYTALRDTSIEQTQMHQLNVTNACGSDSASMSITFLAIPDGVLPGDSLYCLDRAFYLLNQQSAGISYEWNDGTTGPQYRIDSSGTYWLKSMSACDTLIDSFSIVFNGEPKITLPNDTLLCPNESIMIRNLAEGISFDQTYVWSDGSTDSSISISGADTGLINVTVTLRECRINDSIRIYTKGYCPERCKPEIPNVFSPNGDGINDLLKIEMTCATGDKKLWIYNRWGQLVHLATSSQVFWNGYLNGNPAAEGTYYYVLSFTDEAGEERLFKGSFSLLD